MLCMPARREFSDNLQSSRLGLWETVALMELHILREDRQLGRRTWDERVKSSQMGMLGRTFFECIRLKAVYGRRGSDIG